MIYEQATGRDLRVQEDTVTNEGPFPILQRDYRGQRLREFCFCFCLGYDYIRPPHHLIITFRTWQMPRSKRELRMSPLGPPVYSRSDM